MNFITYIYPKTSSSVLKIMEFTQKSYMNKKQNNFLRLKFIQDGKNRKREGFYLIREIQQFEKRINFFIMKTKS